MVSIQIKAFCGFRTKWKRQNQLRLEQLRHQASMEKELISAADHSSMVSPMASIRPRNNILIFSNPITIDMLPNITVIILRHESMLIPNIGRCRSHFPKCQLCSRMSIVSAVA